MERILTIVQVLISIFLVAGILLQQKGSGLGSAFGGEGGNIYSTRRGAEKVLFYSTIVLSLAFLAISLIRIRL
ncbi:MAG: preprotein translocase subunit SecG [Candidatus Yanofskybacteria bacterium RIFCSPHIGHO2_02_FULL_43_15c]|uniref:Protein-export membrane protein SecG n=1 Tax=Candidatus Yanofskybacteria bacterium RIFCSPHIGHO2_02_FULL_43_15c TaxID=1802679 RepID=A0A1F8FGF7_9BACT|nr:MAG: preprotein translocase subunit SecG [Candidatus Yanofskybacteria bacterium RIFCSPHIGHO2_02_FULL_43_15c]